MENMEHFNASESQTNTVEKKDNGLSKKIRDRIVIGATMFTSLFMAKEANAQYTHPENKFSAISSELFAKPGQVEHITAPDMERINIRDLQTLHDKFEAVLKDTTFKFEGVGSLEDGGRHLVTESIKETLKDGGLVIDEFDIVETENSFHIMGQLGMIRYRGAALKTESPHADAEKLFKENDVESQDVDIVIDKKTGLIISFIKGKPYSIPENLDPAGYENNKNDMGWFVIKKDGTGAADNYFENNAKMIVGEAVESTPKENAPVTQEYLQSLENDNK